MRRHAHYTPLIITGMLQKERKVLPTMRQVSDWKYYEKGKAEKAIGTLDDLCKYANSCLPVPEDNNQAFVVGFDSTVIKEMQAFCLVWTTPRLRGLQSRAKSFQVDTTYKLNWNRFPVMVCGFSDAKRKFFCTHLALCSHENQYCYEKFLEFVKLGGCSPRVLIADGDKTITTAAQIVWPECYRAMCFAHVKMNLLKKLRPKILANVKGLMSSDLSFLQTASSESEFKRASDLMEIDWSSKFGQQVKAMEVFKYFLNTWVPSALSNWYEGYSNFAFTNNGLESRNAELKKITFRKKLSLADFMKTAETTMALWSTRPEEQEPADSPEITMALFFEAFNLKKDLEQSDVLKLYKFADCETHILVTKQCNPNEALQMYNELVYCTFNSLSRYLEIRSTMRVIKPSAFWSELHSCNCFIGAEKRLCKHSVMVMCKRGVKAYPAEVTAKQLERRQKVGRPKLASQALLRV